MRNCISFKRIMGWPSLKGDVGVRHPHPTCQDIGGKIALLSGRMRKGEGGNEREREEIEI